MFSQRAHIAFANKFGFDCSSPKFDQSLLLRAPHTHTHIFILISRYGNPVITILTSNAVPIPRNCRRMDIGHDTMDTHIETGDNIHVICACRFAIVQCSASHRQLSHAGSSATKHTFKYCKSWCSGLISSPASVTFRKSIFHHVAHRAFRESQPSANPFFSIASPDSTIQYVVFYN